MTELRGVLWIGSEVFDLNAWVLNSPDTIVSADDINENGVILASVASNYAIILKSAVIAIADLDGNCIVNQSDLLILLAEWNKEESAADLDDSGRVDIFDLFALLSEWTG